MKQYKNILLVVGLLTTASIAAQDMLTINAAGITVQNNASITVQGSVINNTNGTIDNLGTVYVSGNWENNGGNTCLINNSNGWVELNGNSQTIKGTAITDFYNLRLTGTLGSVKTLNINTNVNNQLALGADELQTANNIVYVNNANTNAISWNGGYVASSDLGGYLVRNTTSDSSYTFPVGNSLLAGIYRSVKLTPNSGSARFHGVRLAALNPSNDNTGVSASGAIGPFSEYNLSQDVAEINTLFYHNIHQFSGTGTVTVAIDYFASDGLFSSVAQWDVNSLQWEDQNYTYSSSTSGNNLNNPTHTMSKTNVSNLNSDVFALEKLNIKIPGGLSPNGDGNNDEFYIEGLDYYPENELVIFNRWGDEVFKASPYQNNWEGQSKGSMVLTGNEVVDATYFYVLKLSNEVAPLSGSLELKR